MRRSMMIKLIAAAAFSLISASGALAADAKQMEANKKAVVEFYQKGINDKDFDAAAKYLGPRYIQHNPGAKDGIDGFKAFVAFLKDKFPGYKSEIKRVFADGDYVILHVHNIREPGTRGRAIMDIFRLENGKIVEHWDVAQDIPETMAHNNGMF
ncbi:MAG: ester cyclase [Pseudolabrys sp.]|nr:ester cyclase [Pseudolabrys sp.]